MKFVEFVLYGLIIQQLSFSQSTAAERLLPKNCGIIKIKLRANLSGEFFVRSLSNQTLNISDQHTTEKNLSVHNLGSKNLSDHMNEKNNSVNNFAGENLSDHINKKNNSVNNFAGKNLSDHINEVNNSVNNFGDKQLYESEFAEIGQVPWIVSIGYPEEETLKTFVQTVGTLISNRFVVTSAYSMREVKPGSVGLGVYRIDDTEGEKNRTQVNKVESFKIHPDYNKTGSLENDIALIKLKYKVKFTDFIQPICLPVADYKNNTFDDEEAFEAGWSEYNGNLNWMENKDYILKTIPTKIWNIDNCTLARINTDQVCTSSKEMLKSCLVNNGGPLIWKSSSEKHYLVGISNYQLGTCGIDFMSVHTRVTSLVDWILENIKTM